MFLTLASSSPRRQELLASVGITPTVILSPDVDESLFKGEAPRAYVTRVALLKAQEGHRQTPEAYVLAADTIVETGGKIIGKPACQEEARSILQRLSGKRHRVYTAVCLISPAGQQVCQVVITRVSFKRLTGSELELYLLSKEWEGKAGAYGIQGRAGKFVKFISGSYSNVMGLPLYETECLLRGIGFYPDSL